jgi:hypothetical protein
MVKSKFDKNIIFVGQRLPLPPAQIKMMDDQRKAGNYAEWNMMYAMQDSAVKGSFGMGGSWMINLKGTKPVQIELAHTHDCDEILGLSGSDMDNLDELGGEVELWLEDEKYIITRSCLIFIPKGMKHCPMFVRRVDRPFFFFGSLKGKNYDRSWEEEYR